MFSAGVLLAILSLLLPWYIFRPRLAHNEPKQPPSTVPVVGHLLGFLRFKLQYFVNLSRHHDMALFTLVLFPAQKLYVLTDPRLIQSIERIPSIISWRATQARFAAQIISFSETATETVTTRATERDGFLGEMMAMTHAAMRPGSGDLEDINRSVIKEMLKSLSIKGKVEDVEFYGWLRHAITSAATMALYGPQNPYKDEKIRDAFWTFSRGVPFLTAGSVPSFLAFRARRARDRVHAAFLAYFACQGDKSASALIRHRTRISRSFGLTDADLAASETIHTIAILTNTVPAAFWAIYKALESKKTSDTLTAEAGAFLARMNSGHYEQEGEQKTTATLALRRKDMRLIAHVNEAIRYAGAGPNPRIVTRDTLLDDPDGSGNQVLLKKDTLLIIPTGALHTDPGLWGDDALEFVSERNLKGADGTADGAGRKSVAFRGFGGGSTICPGRHFATTEIVAALAILLDRFEIEFMQGKGGGKGLMPDRRLLSEAVAPVGGGIRARIRLKGKPMVSHESCDGSQ